MEAQAAAHPPLAAALEDGALRKSAASLTRLWARTFEQRVLDLRRSKGIHAQMNRSHVRRPPRGCGYASALPNLRAAC